MAVLLQDGDTETVKGVHIPGVVVSGEPVDALAHLVGRFVGEGDTEDVARQNTQFVDQIGKPVGEGAGLSRACPGNDPHEPLGGSDSLALGAIKTLQQIHGEPS